MLLLLLLFLASKHKINTVNVFLGYCVSFIYLLFLDFFQGLQNKDHRAK